MAVSRRGFLQGASACAVAAALPIIPAVPPVDPMAFWTRILEADAAKFGPIFDGSIGVYQGVIIRRVEFLPEVGVSVRNIPYADIFLDGGDDGRA